MIRRKWKSFWRWRASKPRPSLWQWIRGFRCAMMIDGTSVGFSTRPIIKHYTEAEMCKLDALGFCSHRVFPTELRANVPIQFELNEINEETSRKFFYGDPIE